jgi:hypothetical protein
MHMNGAADRAAEMSARMVENLDADGDGKLSVEELVAMPVPRNAFELADTNKDGVIDQAEADAALEHMMHGPDGHRGHRGQGEGYENDQNGN